MLIYLGVREASPLTSTTTMERKVEPLPPIYIQRDVCDFLLKRLVHAVALEVRESNIPGAGTGLFTEVDLNPGQEIFLSMPLVAVAAAGLEKSVCDNCYNTRFRRVQADGNICFDTECPQLRYIPCPGCGKCYYCSEVQVPMAYRDIPY
jgi:hypothetical protein